MKRIVLKPEIKGGDKFIFDDEEIIAERIYGSHQYQFRTNNGELVGFQEAGCITHVLTISQSFQIVESPDEPEQVADAGKKNSEAFMDAEKNNSEAFMEIFKTLAPEQKPPLKLRVGGVYKNRKGEIVYIIYTTCNEGMLGKSLSYTDKDTLSYGENGNYLIFGWDSIESKDRLPHSHDLIEEVLPDEKQVEYCECANKKGDPYDHSALSYKRRLNKILCDWCSKEFLFASQKSEGNPFKVGDKCLVHYCWETITRKPIAGSKEFIIAAIENECCYVASTWVHYKQCERIEK